MAFSFLGGGEEWIYLTIYSSLSKLILLNICLWSKPLTDCCKGRCWLAAAVFAGLSSSGGFLPCRGWRLGAARPKHGYHIEGWVLGPMCFASTRQNLIFFHPDAFSLEGEIVLIATLGRKYQALCLQITSGNEQDRTVDNCVIVSGPLTSLKTSEQSKYSYVRYKIFPNLFSSFWKGFPKGGSGLCADALFSQLLGRAASSFWQSGETDMTDLEHKEQGKFWRIKPGKNKWVDSMNGHIFFITSFLCTSHCHVLLLSTITFRLN